MYVLYCMYVLYVYMYVLYVYMYVYICMYVCVYVWTYRDVIITSARDQQQSNNKYITAGDFEFSVALRLRVFNFCLFKFWGLSDSRCHVPWNSTDLLVLLRSPTSQGPARVLGRGQLKCDGTRSETRFLLSTKRTSLFKSAGLSVQSTTDSRGVRISCSNAGYNMFRGSVRSTGYPTTFASFPFTYPPVRHRVPSHFNGLYHVPWNSTDILVLLRSQT